MPLHIRIRNQLGLSLQKTLANVLPDFLLHGLYCRRLCLFAFVFVSSLDWASGEHQKMFPADMADFYQIFLHAKQISVFKISFKNISEISKTSPKMLLENIHFLSGDSYLCTSTSLTTNKRGCNEGRFPRIRWKRSLLPVKNLTKNWHHMFYRNNVK